MVFKGSERRPSAMAIAEAIEGAGGILNTYTTQEITCFWNHLPFEKLELALDVLAGHAGCIPCWTAQGDRPRALCGAARNTPQPSDQPGIWVRRAAEPGHLRRPAHGLEHRRRRRRWWRPCSARASGYPGVWYVPAQPGGERGRQRHAESEVLALARRYFDDRRPAKAFPLLRPRSWPSLPGQRVEQPKAGSPSPRPTCPSAVPRLPAQGSRPLSPRWCSTTSWGGA